MVITLYLVISTLNFLVGKRYFFFHCAFLFAFVFFFSYLSQNSKE